MSSNHGYRANKWEHLMGRNHWEGLLDPLDINLRKIIIHYGEMAQATYDTFIREKYSKYSGTSRYSKKNFFAKLGLELGRPYKYRVTKFIYATSGVEVPDAFMFKSLSEEPWLKNTNFMGYVAVAEDESVRLLGRRDIVVAWRGSVKFLEWINDFQFLQVSASDIFGCQGENEDDVPEVHQGWYSIYTSDNLLSRFDKTSARDQVLQEVTRLVEHYKNEEMSITVTGHSLGAALATLNAVDMVTKKVNVPNNIPNAKPCLVTAIVFASPRVGDRKFKNTVSKIVNLRVLRVRNAHDIVPNYPLIDYSDVGDELMIDSRKSPYLKNPGAVSCTHNMEVYMHGVAGLVQGIKGFEFKLMVERDIALLNKYRENLKDEYFVPVGWWVQKFMGMVQQSDGSWLLMDRELDEDDEFN
ncbi:phospholipase A1-IIgamma-like [Silene latifolia]|uniref:phospholipase A1-IIgamma-like n=1 Tax=Silene latifolia TaxID=37657 RepID=UPI003D770741